MNKILNTLLVFSVLFSVPAWAAPDQVEGTIQGFTCVTQGKVCPVGKEDPVVAAERLFVVLDYQGKYSFVSNLDRAVMARHIRERVKVTGERNPQYNSIKANTFQVWKNGKWETTWTQKEQADWYKEIEDLRF